MIETIKIKGLDCANCARELEEEISSLEGVRSATVDFMASRVVADCEEGALERVKRCCNNFEEVKVVEDEPVAEISREGRRIKIANLCCANCGRELEEELNAIDGVSATVDFMNMTVVLNAANSEAYDKAIYAITHFEDVRIVDGKPPKRNVFEENKVDIITILISAIFFIPAIVFDLGGFEWAKWYVYIPFYAVAFAFSGYIVLWNTARNVAKGKIFDENFLMAVASVGAIGLGITTGDGLFEGVAVMLLYRIGELLQSIAVGASRRSISDLMDLKSDTATLIDGDRQVVVSPESLKIGDKILVKAGEKIPVDCVIAEGASSLDMKSLNGEAVPRDVGVGDEVLSGAINLTGAITAEVVREYKNSAVAKILELVENSTSKKAKSEKFITTFARYYTPIVVIAAVLLASIVPTVVCGVNAAFAWETYREWIYKALSFLVISCPCALVISVPLSYFGGIGRCARSGILVKGSTSLDALAEATIAAFDKTGTLTEGTFRIVEYSSERALKLAAAAERYSSHPIAAAFKDVRTDYAATDAEEVAGRGIKCRVRGKELLCGNGKFMEENGVAYKRKRSIATLIYVALGGEYVGVIDIDDTVKAGAREALTALREQGIEKTCMLTGDSAERAKAVASKIGMGVTIGSLLPDEKLEEAKKLKKEGKLIYVGDGINDAPVMTVADCAVSMGQVGSDAAIEASDVVLVSDNLALLPEAKKIAKGTRRIVCQNIVGSLVVKFAIMMCSVFIPSFPLIIAIFGDVGVMLLAVANAMRTALIGRGKGA